MDQYLLRLIETTNEEKCQIKKGPWRRKDGALVTPVSWP